MDLSTILVLLGFSIVFFVCAASLINDIIKGKRFMEEKAAQEAEQEAERQREQQREEERRQELYRKAEFVNSTYKSRLESLYKEKVNCEAMAAVNGVMRSLDTYAASKSMTHDPYIRGGAASAIGGPALGLYTALQTDAENKRSEELRQNALNRANEWRKGELSYGYQVEKINKEIEKLETTINREYDILNKASELGESYVSELRSLYSTRDQKEKYYEQCRAQKNENAPGSENIRLSKILYESSKAKNAVEEFEKKIEEEYNTRSSN